jgi:uncharacterized membrane protein (UPF0127 family)
MIRKLLRLAVFLTASAAALSASAQQMPTIELGANLHRIVAEVAATDQDRILGLMQRTSMPPNQGMLFVFAFEAPHCMWMRNTLLPLSVAFLDETGKIINVAEMKPQTETNHCATRPARYALEMNSGWFAKRGLGAGTRLTGIERAPQPH